jgi:hypothetical protein
MIVPAPVFIVRHYMLCPIHLVNVKVKVDSSLLIKVIMSIKLMALQYKLRIYVFKRVMQMRG